MKDIIDDIIINEISEVLNIKNNQVESVLKLLSE